jgi:hypothetical protein
MKYKLGFLVLSLLLLPTASYAQVNTSLNINGSYTTGTDSQFTAVVSDYQNGLVSVLTFADTNANEIKSALFQDKSGWVRLTPYQSGSDVIAKFVSDNGFDTSTGKSITFRVNFSTPKTYVIGLSLQDGNGRTTSSAAAPVTVTGPKVLGESTTPISSPTVSGATFNRTLTYGMSGSDVTALQTKLTAEGFYSGPITGFFGRLTQTAVKKYQSAHGISPANGVVGPQTLTALNQ